MEFNQEKFKALVHYICAKAHDPSVLGATKLNKVLWHSDGLSFIVTGAPITGESYIKRQFGPVPQHILRAMDDLQREGDIVVRNSDYHGFQKREYVSLKEPDLSAFSGAEIDLVNRAFNYVCHAHTAASISEATHDDIWQLAEIGEVLPYETILASEQGEVDEEDMKWALEALGDAA